MSHMDIEQLKLMTKTDLQMQIQREIAAYGLKPEDYRYVSRTSKTELLDIIMKVRTDGDQAWTEVLSKTSDDAAEDTGEDSWEYAEPDKPRWMEADATEDNESQNSEDAEFEEVEELEDSPEPENTKAAKNTSGRKNRGPNKNRRYNDEDILEMVRLVTEAGWSKAKVARQFECSSTFIHNLFKGNVYSDVTGFGTNND